jgi:hypothetical protein
LFVAVAVFLQTVSPEQLVVSIVVWLADGVVKVGAYGHNARSFGWREGAERHQYRLYADV